MRMREVLSQVGGSPSPSIPELLFREFSQGRIKKDEYDTRTAIWVADNAREYKAQPYPKLSDLLLDYVQSRVSGIRETREPALNLRLGTWTKAIRSLLEQNDSDHSLLVWSLERCQAKGLDRHVKAITNRLAGFDLSAPEHLDAALACQQKDSEQKQREERAK